MAVIFVTAGAPPTVSQSGAGAMLGGTALEGIYAKLRDDHYTASYRGNGYQSHTLTAGTTIPVQATNLVSTFTIWNPLGSGVIVELVRYTAAFLAATTVVSDVSLYIQTAVGGANAAPGTLTALAVRPSYWSSSVINPTGANKANMYSAATLVNTMATNMFRGPTLFGPTAVTSTALGPINFDFRGTVLLGPGTLATTAGNAAQTSATAQSLYWNEWPFP
jgi:hypothetical protein